MTICLYFPCLCLGFRKERKNIIRLCRLLSDFHIHFVSSFPSLIGFLDLILSHSVSGHYHHLPCCLSEKPSLPILKRTVESGQSHSSHSCQIHPFLSILFILQTFISHLKSCEIFLIRYPAPNLCPLPIHFSLQSDKH